MTTFPERFSLADRTTTLPELRHGKPDELHGSFIEHSSLGINWLVKHLNQISIAQVRTSKLTIRVRNLFAAVDSHPFAPGIWLRECTANMFNLGRIPQAHCDTFSEIPSPSHPDAKKLLVMLHDWFYAVDVYDAQFKLLPVVEIERRLRSIVEHVKRRQEAGEIEAVPVGLLTADNRDLWAKVVVALCPPLPADSLDAEPAISTLVVLKKS
jgi:Choline/Carnitine o-acyltransferase